MLTGHSDTQSRFTHVMPQEVSIRGLVRTDGDSLPDGLPLLEAVCMLGRLEAEAAAVLIDLGAVYTGREIKVCCYALILGCCFPLSPATFASTCSTQHLITVQSITVLEVYVAWGVRSMYVAFVLVRLLCSDANPY